MEREGDGLGQVAGTSKSVMKVVNEAQNLRCCECGWYCYNEWRSYDHPKLGIVTHCSNPDCVNHNKRFLLPVLELQEVPK